MDLFKEGWFTEVFDMCPGITLSIQIDKVLHHEVSKYQDILLLETKHHGRALVLDGIIQCTEFDEFSYQEMISFLPLCCHPNPKKVLIVGGGDGGVAREVVKHPSVELVEQVEIDERVVNLCKEYLPSMALGFTHPKVKLHIADGFAFMKSRLKNYDVIITDSSDPIGPAVPLFQQEYFQLMRNALKPGGIVCSQASNPWSKTKEYADVHRVCKQIFPSNSFAYASVPTYPNGIIGFALGSLNKETNFNEPVRIFTEEELASMKMKYYNADVHRAAFSLPNFMRKALEVE
uniref:Putative spermidine synthase n=1 Tax=Panstrongylus lignarius TaxID=156445 RepID=A0A224XH52_9HEMI